MIVNKEGKQIHLYFGHVSIESLITLVEVCFENTKQELHCFRR